MIDPPAIVPRALDLAKLAGRKSLILVEPGEPCKTALARHGLPEARVYDLLDTDVFLSFCRRPAQMGEELGLSDPLVVLDEIQTLPVLLDQVSRSVTATSGACARSRRRRC
jgi:hypothetical protein